MEFPLSPAFRSGGSVTGVNMKPKDWEPQPKSKKILNAKALDVLAALKMVTRAPSIKPGGLTAYLISPEKMAEYAKLVATVEGK